MKKFKEVDFTVKSEPWTEEELADFRILMEEIKRKIHRKHLPLRKIKTKKQKA